MTTDGHEEGALVAGGGRLDQIRLSGITAMGYHGVFAFERREGQTFVADVVVHLDTRRAAARDDLAYTLDYGALATQVAAVLSGEPVDLIETVAERIAATVLASGVVQAVDVSVHKPQAPIDVPFGDVVVTIHRDRSKLPAAEPYLPRPENDEAPQPARHAPPPTATFPVTPAPGAPAVAAAVVAPVAPPAEVAAVAPPMVPWSDIVPPLGTGVAVADGWGPQAGATGAGAEVVGEIISDALDDAPATPVDIVLALGANLGAAQDTLRRAVAELDHTPGIEVVQVSPLARTAAVGGPEQPDFLNAVVLGRTTLSPRDLLRATQAVEQAHGRERTEHWAPRTLDIDIIVFGSVLAVTDDLELPHPRAHERAFVLEPWTQVDPHAQLPGLGGGPVAALAATAPDRAGIRWLALDWLTAPTQAAPDDTVATAPDDREAPGPVPQGT